MPLPGDLTTCVLTGTFTDPAGNPMRGTVTICPNATLTDATGNVIVSQLQRAYQLFNGSFTTAPLVATDNADINPQGFAYVITIALQEVETYSFTVLLPHSPSPVDLSALSPAVLNLPDLASYLSMTGGTLTGKLTLDGSIPLQIPAGAAAGDVLTSDASGNASWSSVSADGIATASALAAETSRAETAEGLLAPKASPALTGTPTAPTATALTDNTQIATTAYTDSAAAAAKAAAIAASLPTLTANVSVSASGTLALNTVTEASASGSALTMTLPSSTTGDVIVCEKSDSSTNTVAVTGSIRGVGSSTLTLKLQNESTMFLGYAGSWWPVAGHKTLGSLDGRYSLVQSSDTVIYVSASGSDSNSGVSPGLAKLTIPAAITALGSNAGTVRLLAGTIIDTAGIVVPANVSIEGEGSAVCTIDSRAATASISGTNSAGWYKQHFTGFAVSHANNTNTGVTFITHSLGMANCRFDDLHLQANGTASSDGIYIVDNLGGPTGVCNAITNTRIERTSGTGTVSGSAVNLAGAGNNASVNSNLISNCAINFYSTGVYIQGQNNVLQKVIWNSCTTALHVQGDTVTIDNFATGCYFDGSVTTKILLDDTSNTSVHHMLTVTACINVTAPSQVTLGTHPSMIAFSLTGRNQAIGSSTPTSLNGSQAPAVYGGPTTGLVSFMGDQTFTSGRIIAAGSAYAGSSNAVSNNGGLSAAIQNTSGTAFRVVTTSNGSSFTIVAAVDNSGNLTLPSGGLVAAAALPAATASVQGAVILDGTSTDIQPVGTQAAGSSTQAAKADHVHAATLPNVQFFTSSGTWTKPAGAQTVLVTILGAGGGGGSGRQGASASVCCGGGGGGGGALHFRQFAAADLASTAAIGIGAGGTGGAAVSATSTSGNNGTGGTGTSFGTYFNAGGGSPGSGGTAASGLAGTGSSGGSSVGGSGAIASTSGAAGNVPVAAAGAPGGGSGGGITTAAAASAGGSGIYTFSGSGSSSTYGTGGVVDTTTPTSGTAPAVKGTPGGSPGGGASSVTTTAQTGAAGNYGTGGGGGGASLNGNNSGAGGAGGSGFALVVTFFQ